MMAEHNQNSLFFEEAKQLDLAHPALHAIPHLPSRLKRIRNHLSQHNIDLLLAVYDLPFIVLFLVFIYIISPFAFLIFLVFVTAGVVFQLFLSIREHRIRSLIAEEKYRTDYVENELLSAAFTDASLRVKNQFFNELQNQDGEILSKQLKLLSNQQNQKITSQFLSYLLLVFIIFSSVILVFNGELQIGGLIALNILVAKSFFLIIQIPPLWIFFFARKNHNEIKMLKQVAPGHSGTSRLNMFSGDVRLNSISFHYQNSHPQSLSLNNLNHHFIAGTTTAITGDFASGKSTLLRLIAGRLVPQSGQIQIDGVNLQQIAPEWWDIKHALLPEEPQFLNTSLYSYLRQWDADEEAVSAAIVQSGLKAVTDQLPEGVHTSLQDSRFSSLKIRKRVALCGIIAKDAQLILMDDPTIGIDAEAAMLFYNFMNRMMAEKRTLIITTSDPVILKGAHQCLTIDGNRLVKSGAKPSAGRTTVKQTKSVKRRPE